MRQRRPTLRRIPLRVVLFSLPCVAHPLSMKLT
jgi:hypothetical protein